MNALPDNRVTIDATLAGRPAKLLLNTAGFSRAITTEMASMLNLRGSNFDIDMRDVNGNRTDRVVTVRPVTIGDKTLARMQFRVMPEDSDGRDDQGLPLYNGQIALDISTDDYDLDFGGKRFAIVATDHCGKQAVRGPASAMVPFDFDSSGHVTFTATVNGKPLRAILQTGSKDSTLDIGVAKDRFGIDIASPDVRPADELIPGRPAYKTRLTDLRLGTVTVSGPDITLIPRVFADEQVTGTRVVREHAMPDVMIGMDILKTLRVYVATKARKLYITPSEAEDPGNAATP